MAVSAAHKRASYKYNAARDAITIRPSKEDGAKIRDAAKSAGQSIQNYLMQAAKERMQRDAETAEQSAQHSIEDSAHNSPAPARTRE